MNNTKEIAILCTALLPLAEEWGFGKEWEALIATGNQSVCNAAWNAALKPTRALKKEYGQTLVEKSEKQCRLSCEAWAKSFVCVHLAAVAQKIEAALNASPQGALYYWEKARVSANIASKYLDQPE